MLEKVFYLCSLLFTYIFFSHSQKVLQLVLIQHKSSLLAHSELIFVAKKQFCFVKLLKKVTNDNYLQWPQGLLQAYKLFFSVHFLTGTLRTANLTFGGHSLTTYKSNMNGLSMHRKSLILEFLAHYFIAFHREFLSLFSDYTV